MTRPSRTTSGFAGAFLSPASPASPASTPSGVAHAAVGGRCSPSRCDIRLALGRDLTGFGRTPLCWGAANMDDRLSSDLASLRIDRNERPPSPSSAGAVRWLIGTAVVAAAAFAAWHVAAPMVEAKLFKTEVGVTEVALVSPAQAQVEL